MGEPLHDIDKLFLDNIEGHTENPPKNVWDNIEAGLDKTSAVVYKKKYEKTKRAAVILLLLISGILIYEIASVRHGKNDPDGNTVKKSNTENVTVQTNNDEVKASSKQEEKNVVFPEADSSQLLNKQDAGLTVQNDKIDAKTVTKEDDNLLTPEKNTSLPVQEKKTIVGNGTIKPEKNKTTQNIQQPDLTTIPDAGVTVIRKDKKPLKKMDVTSNQKPEKNEDDKKKDDNLTANIVLPADKLVKKQNITPPAILPEQEERRLAPVSEQSKPKTEASTIAAKFLKQVSTSAISRISQLPVIALPKTSAKELAKAARKISKANAGKPGLYLSFFVSPNAAWNSLENDEPHRGGNSSTHIEDHDAIKKGEHNNLSYTGGLKLGYTINKNLSVQTGLNYTSVSTSIDPKLIFADRDNNGNVRYRLDCSSGYSFLLPSNIQNPNRGDSLVVSDSRNSLAYAGVPLAIEYKIVTGKVSVSATVGGQANILTRGKTTTTFGKGTTNETSASGTTHALKSTYFSAITGITGEFKLNKRLSLTVTPASQFGLSSINKGGSVKTHSNYFSVGAGLKLRL
jgi:hypothetical protein